MHSGAQQNFFWPFRWNFFMTSFSAFALQVKRSSTDEFVNSRDLFFFSCKRLAFDWNANDWNSSEIERFYWTRHRPISEKKKTAAVAWRRGKFFVVAPRSAAGAGSMPSVHSMEVSLIGKINPAADAERPRLWRWMRRMIKSNATEMDDAVNCIGPPREAHERK